MVIELRLARGEGGPTRLRLLQLPTVGRNSLRAPPLTSPLTTRCPWVHRLLSNRSHLFRLDSKQNCASVLATVIVLHFLAQANGVSDLRLGIITVFEKERKGNHQFEQIRYMAIVYLD